MRSYDPKKVTFSLFGVPIVHFAKGSMIKVGRTEDGWKLTIGAQGEGARTRSQDQSGFFEITLLASSPSNDFLSALVLADELRGEGVGAAMMKDGSGSALASAQNAWIVKMADIERGAELGEVTWRIETDKLEIQQGGTTDTPNAAAAPSVG